MEPVHWFDPAAALPIEEGVLIHALDEVYPDLKLLDRVTAARQTLTGIGPEVREPAHLRPEVRDPAHFNVADILRSATASGSALARPEVREPAHFRPGDVAERATDVLKQKADVLRRAGF